jgi:hypothetical protein
VSFQQVPTYEQSLTKSGQTSSVWYRFFQGLYQGIAPAAEVTVAVSASPFAYTFQQRGFLIVRGGTVTAVQFTRTATNLTGQTAGIFPGSQGDIVNITYSGLPTVIFVPQ